MRYVITAVVGATLLAGGMWMGTSIAQAQNLQLKAAGPVCAAGFTVSGTNRSYTCTSATFKCNAGMTIFQVPGVIAGPKYRYTCAYPEG